jgi:hypothetical protein
LTPDGVGQSPSELLQQVGNLLPRKDGRVTEAVLRTGIYLSSYRLGRIGEEESKWQAFLAPDHESLGWLLDSFTDRRDAVAAVNKLRRLIIALNVGSEGMHVIEHILLRPRGGGEGERSVRAVDSDFFAFRLSVVFPAWTARFQDGGFRQLARETVCLNCPAQVVPEVIWLGLDDMREFEHRQDEWLLALAGEDGATGGADAASARLVEFLEARRGTDCWAPATTTGNGGRSAGRSHDF